ncbi:MULTISPECIES: c-type cytochrome [Burkholderia]|uniref:c-type cytochrome n=1 Tax=Burkholderia TaxID=32008 RepID=UPI00119C0CA3|nr:MULTISPECIES: cytochrome c [Burkholderia]MDN7737651.1 cytochrome c [Burkholderia gladioli]TWC73131.1 nicotinate dehydrogenase subunit B [Burkholderia sp. SJZ089]TWD03325.1 nicotinate dehydrogenase subunit B [Burkholderia sp. SJZ115]TWD08216.1 nicotinate dehydrogenase subunit B [Burkholderia sp. SJZ091]
MKPDRAVNQAESTALAEAREAPAASLAARGGHEAGREAEVASRRHAEYGWPTGTPGVSAMLEVEAGISEQGRLASWRYRARLSTASGEARSRPVPVSGEAPAHGDSGAYGAYGGRALPFVYRHAEARIEVEDPAFAIPAHAHVFARESGLDECAAELRADPVELRLRHLDPVADAGAQAVIRMVSERARWQAPAIAVPASSWLRGRGFAFDGRRVEADRAEQGAPGAASLDARPDWSAWVVDIEVDPASGDVALRRVVAGQGAGEPGPDGLPRGSGVAAAQVEATVARLLGVQHAARHAFDESAGEGGAGGDALAYELTRAGQATSELAAAPDLASLDPAERARLERAAAPAAAAIANALYDATGVRFRAPPFDARTVREALATHQARAAMAARQPTAAQRWRRWLKGGGIGGVVGGLIGLAGAMLPGPAPIAPIPAGSAGGAQVWSAETLERGRLVAIAGDCAVCHTAPGGKPNAGGFPLETPFGTIYSTNLTPDAETGIGNWSYPAFARAMREGISRDGHHLYPAFPYTAFARLSEPDMLALYAYLMSQPAVKAAAPPTRLPFPMNQRRLVAGWNWLYHDDTPYVPDPARSAQWNRGKYLVDGAGHCSACHSPRNALGAEKGGFAYLSGGQAEGWDAPALVAASHAAPVPWTEDALFRYLRTGFSPEHGVAAGPMAPVVAGLAELPEGDVRAIAHYLASLSPSVDAQAASAAAASRAGGAELVSTLGMENGRRAFDAACAVCHAESGGVGHFGVRPLMGLNTSVSHANPDNLLRVLQNGIAQPATAALGYMPAFRDEFDDRQMAELAAYIRKRYAPDQPAWRDLEAASARIRAQGAGH